jgi:hypothetical protein
MFGIASILAGMFGIASYLAGIAAAVDKRGASALF